MARPDPDIAAHLEWIGFVRPTGLVVSAPALVQAGVILDRRDTEGQARLRQCLDPAETEPCLTDFRTFAESVLGWRFSANGYSGTADAPLPAELEMPVAETGEVLRPTFAVWRGIRKGQSDQPPTTETPQGADKQPVPPWQLLVSVCEPRESFDRVTRRARGGLEASPHGRLERLLRHSAVPAGLLFNGEAVRLVSAPRGESSGWLDFRVRDMLETAGRPICAAMRNLLGEQRLLAVPPDQRLAALLARSRKFQNEVSERLAEQVLHALCELLRGFQAAQHASRGELLETALADSPNEVYRGLLTVVLRLVFLLYAEERDMLPQDETFLGAYSLAGLYERLREDAAMHPDTMDQRYGAWAQFLALSRMVHDGARSGAMHLPERHGELFDPDRYRFLEGRKPHTGGAPGVSERIEPPLVPDGTLHRVLEKLIVLDGERISYRALDVEHVGAVYETMMGFRLETASGRTAAIKAAKKYGAPAAVDLDALLGEPAAKRGKWLQDRTDRKLTDRVRRAVQAADTMETLHAALDPVIDKNATPDLVDAGAMILQPSEERRRSGSHYTPRELTEPIVRVALGPVLRRLRGSGDAPPRAEQILDLKVCDPAMGSGAFLVEVCRQLGDALVESWHAHDDTPDTPPDEDEVIFARRLVAQRCLYGVDRNPASVDLAKLSLWLATLAKEHPLTFLNHALRHGDSLVGCSLDQIEAFHWRAGERQRGFEAREIRERLASVHALRRRIREADDSVPDWELRRMWDDARFEGGRVALLGDLLVAAFFEGGKPKEREKHRTRLASDVTGGAAEEHRGWFEGLRDSDPPLAPFHWEAEFPEVFERERPGFDAIVGNPPFAGKNTVRAANAPGYPEWLKELHAESHGNSDLVAHFFRRAFNLLRERGTFGLIATNTIAQGDTRSTGLRWISEHGGEIYRANRRFKWPGQAAVVVSLVHVHRGRWDGPRSLDDQQVSEITAFLFHRGGSKDPARLGANAGKSFQGSIVLGMGFTFDDTDRKGVATPLAEMERLIEANPRNRDVILPYIGGEEVNSNPAHAHHRYVINFRDWPLRRADLGENWRDADAGSRRDWLRGGIVPLDYPEPVAADWPELLGIVRERAKPGRFVQNDKVGRESWWRFLRTRPELRAAIVGLERVLAISEVGQHTAFAFLPPQMVFSHTLKVFALDTHAAFCTLQSRPHEIWARFFGSSLEERLRYTPSDCFETFPFPPTWQDDAALEAVGKNYYDFRAGLMVANDEGLTKTYNRFHDPYEKDLEIAQLRDLHTAMDRAVLDAYGWKDILTSCDYFLDYPIDQAEWGNKKKPYRYRWPDDIRDEVLARLLELNARRAAEESDELAP